jgi:hypothetical protein
MPFEFFEMRKLPASTRTSPQIPNSKRHMGNSNPNPDPPAIVVIVRLPHEILKQEFFEARRVVQEARYRALHPDQEEIERTLQIIKQNKPRFIIHYESLHAGVKQKFDGDCNAFKNTGDIGLIEDLEWKFVECENALATILIPRLEDIIPSFTVLIEQLQLKKSSAISRSNEIERQLPGLMHELNIKEEEITKWICGFKGFLASWAATVTSVSLSLMRENNEAFNIQMVLLDMLDRQAWEFYFLAGELRKANEELEIRSQELQHIFDVKTKVENTRVALYDAKGSLRILRQLADLDEDIRGSDHVTNIIAQIEIISNNLKL